MYVIFEDLERATGPAVHRDDCPRYIRRKIGAKTVRWHNGFPDYAAASAKAKSIERPPKCPACLNPPCCKPAA